MIEAWCGLTHQAVLTHSTAVEWGRELEKGKINGFK